MATPDTKYFTIPEADTIKVAKAVAQLVELPPEKLVHIKNLGPWEPDAVRFVGSNIIVSRIYGHMVNGRYMPSNEYRVIFADAGVQIRQLSDEEIAGVVKEQQRPRIDRRSGINRVLHFFASRNGNS